MTELSVLEAKLGHRFSELALLEQALTHGSVRHEHQAQQAAGVGGPAVKDNERLEFLGDAIVGMVMADLLYRRYPELNEGELTRMRAALVSRKHLGMVGAKLDLGAHLHLGKAEERSGGRTKSVLLANCMEALIGALYLDGGLPAATGFVERTVAGPYIDALRSELRENRAIGDFKTALQELLQSRRAGQPQYVLQSESGPDHRKRFVVEVRVDKGKAGYSAKGESTTKKKAEQEAARRLWELLSGRRSDTEPVDTALVGSLAGPSADSRDEQPTLQLSAQPGPGSVS
jgi:ribonuclease-3